MSSKTFCPIPWNFQAVRNNGDIRICCQANVTKNQGVVRHEDGTSFNAGRDDFDEAKNAPMMRIVRKNMLAGRWSEECGRCKSEEEAGLQSRRLYELEHWDYSYDDATRDTAPDGSITVRNQYYDLRFGNLCNLACRMCGPTDSHTWYEQWLGYHGGTSYEDTHGTVELKRNAKGRLETTDYDWHNSETFWEQIEKNIPYIEHVYMAGGEPMMIERHYEFLQRCIDSGYAGNIMIEYNTNMTSLPPRVLKMWEHFKQIRLGCSIDGMGDVLEYQRWPIKWKQAKANLEKVDNLPNNIVAWIAFTVTAYNIFHLPEFMMWKLKESGFKKINSSPAKPVITHHVAHGPKRANIRILNKELKQDVHEHYNYYKNKLAKDDTISDKVKDKFNKILDSVTKYMDAEDYSEKIPEFIKFTNYLDKERKQNILMVTPQYKEMFDENRTTGAQ